MILFDRLAEHARNRSDAIAVREVATNRTISYSHLAAEVNDLADRLRMLPNSGPVILRCPNVLEYHIAFLGILRAERAVFPVPWDIAGAEVERAAATSGAQYMLTESLCPAEIADASELAVAGAALLLQSSGTTGLPKIACKGPRAIDAAQCIVDSVRFTPSDHVLAAVPLCHSYGLEHGLLAPMLAGSCVHLMRGFDIAAIERELAAGITLFPAVPSIFELLAGSSMSLAKLRCAYSAGAPLPASVTDALQKHLSLRVGQIYGTTEFGSATFNDPSSADFDPVSVGQPMPGFEMRIDGGSLLSVRAPTMFSRYIEGTDSLSGDGFFLTGDLARRDDRGRLYITGRSKLLIDVGGLKVNPLEVEAVLAEHPDVAVAVIVPVKVTDTISRLKALIVPRDPSLPPAVEDLRAYARSKLTPYKVPRIFEIRADIPRSATGKILRHLLAEAR